MKKKTIIILVICLLFSILISTGVFALEGCGDVIINVVDENNNAIEGARIDFGSYQMVQTDSTGAATINNVEYGIHSYIVNYGFDSEAYYAATGSINISNQSEVLNVKLQPVLWLTGITAEDKIDIDGDEIYPLCENYEFAGVENGDRLIYGLNTGKEYTITSNKKGSRQAVEKFQMERIYYYQAPFLPYYILKGNIIDSQNEMNINSGILNVYDLLHNLIKTYAITNGTFDMDLDYKYYQLEIKSEGYEDNVITVSPPQNYPEFVDRDIYLNPITPVQCTVVVNCVDIDTNEFLTERIFKNLLISDAPWALDLPTIENYTFVSGEYFTDGNLTERTFIAKYKKNEITPQKPDVKGSIVIKYIDSDNSIIGEEAKKDLQLGSHTLTAKVFERYELNDVSTKSVILTDDDPNQIVTFTYKKKPEPIPEPTPIAEIEGSIDVQYIDEHSNIIKQEIMNDFTLGTYDIVAKEIAGYKLNDISTKTVDLSEQNPIQVVIFQYKTVEVPPTKPESKPEPKPDKEQDADKVEELLQYGTVKGKATDIYGNPIINLRVELHSEPRATFTNEYGEYEFVDVELGEHTITVIDARFQEVSKFEIIVKAMNSAENIVLTNLANAPLTLSEEVRDREVDIIVTPRLVIEDEEGIDEKSIDKDIAETIEVGEQNQDPIIPVKAKEPDVQPQQPEIIDKKLPQTGDSGLLETILLMVFLLLGVWYFFLKKR